MLTTIPFALLNRTQLGENGLVRHHRRISVFCFENITAAPSRFPALAKNLDATYVLLTDDIADDHYNPDFYWSRHLPTKPPA